MRKLRYSKKLMAEINVVPYIDVMLVLLIIFMVTAPLLQQGVIVDLPKAAAKTLAQAPKEPIVVSVNKEGQYFLNVSSAPHLPLAASALQLQVLAHLQQDKERKVLVKADAQVNYAQVMGAMVALQEAGVGSIGLVTQNDEQKE